MFVFGSRIVSAFAGATATDRRPATSARALTPAVSILFTFPPLRRLPAEHWRLINQPLFSGVFMQSGSGYRPDLARKRSSLVKNYCLASIREVPVPLPVASYLWKEGFLELFKGVDQFSVSARQDRCRSSIADKR